MVPTYREAGLKEQQRQNKDVGYKDNKIHEKGIVEEEVAAGV